MLIQKPCDMGTLNFTQVLPMNQGFFLAESGQKSVTGEHKINFLIPYYTSHHFRSNLESNCCASSRYLSPLVGSCLSMVNNIAGCYIWFSPGLTMVNDIAECFNMVAPCLSMVDDITGCFDMVFPTFLAPLSITCSRGGFRVVMYPSSTISLNIFSSQTAGPIWTKLGRNVPWEVLFKKCSQKLIPSKTLVAMATKLNFLSNSLKIFSSETTGPILK